MFILVTGIPKAGKTKLARKIAKENGYKVVDNIATKFSKDTDLAIGTFCDYRTNFSLAGLRFHSEYINKNENCVFTSSLVDSLVYSTFWTEMNGDFSEDARRLLPDVGVWTTGAIAAMLDSTWNFDRTIFIDYPHKDEVWSLCNEAYRRVLNERGIKFETIGRKEI